MTEKTKNLLLVGLLVTVAFLLGRRSSDEGGRTELRAEPAGFASTTPPAGTLSLPPQGRRTGTGGPKTPVKGTGEPEETALVYETGGSAGHANGFIAVTGSYGVGTSVLYVLDTRSRQLAVYEARGGSLNSRRLYLVGARRVDLDLQLWGYNDESEFSYDALRKRFDELRGGGSERAAPSKESESTVPDAGKGR